MYNQHKQQLMRQIERQIIETDSISEELANRVYGHSKKRLQEIKKRHEQASREISVHRHLKTSNQKIKKDLLGTLELLKKEQQSLESELATKQNQSERIERQIIYVEQKSKEEKPHVESYLRERSKSGQSNQNVQYAKQKLRQLEQKYQKESQQVEYKYRLICMMRQQLKEAKTNKPTRKNTGPTLTSCYVNSQLDSLQNAMIFPRSTEESQIESSLLVTMRE